MNAHLAWDSSVIVSCLLILLLGIFTGWISAIMGVGGGFIFTPFFHSVVGLPIIQAIATSTAQIPLTSLSGLLKFIKAGTVHYKIGLIILLSAIPISQFTIYYFGGPDGVQWGQQTFINNWTRSDFIIGFLFSTVLVCSGVYTIIISYQANIKANFIKPIKLLPGILIGILVGFLSAILGIGGGFILVPFLLHAYNLPPVEATSTSQFCIAPMTIVSTLHYFSQGHIFILGAILASLGGIIGSRVGANNSLTFKPKKLSLMIGVFQIVVAGFYIWNRLN